MTFAGRSSGTTNCGLPSSHRGCTENGQRLPLDVYQRLVNANFNLNVPRTPLIWEEHDDNWSYLASDQCGQQSETKRAWSEFQEDLDKLEKEWRTREPWHTWRVYPSMLEVNIND